MRMDVFMGTPSLVVSELRTLAGLDVLGVSGR